MKNFLPCFFFVFILLGCKHSDNEIQNNENDNTIIVNKGILSQNDSLNIIESVKFIPLETNNNCLVSEIYKLIHYNSKFYIVDKVKNAVYIFSDQGQFINKLSKQGKGPSEYVRITDISIDRSFNQLVLLSTTNSSLFCYDINTLKFSHKIKYSDKIVPSTFKCIGSGKFVLNRNHFTPKATVKLNNLVVINDKGESIAEGAPYRNSMINTMLSRNNLSNGLASILYANPSDQSIYEITKLGEIKKACQMNFGELGFKYELFENEKKLNVQNIASNINKIKQETKKQGKIIGPIGVCDSGAYTIFEYLFKAKRLLLAYNKTNKKLFCLTNIKDVEHGVPGLFKKAPLGSVDENTFVNVVEPSTVKKVTNMITELMASGQNPKADYSKLMELAQRLKSDDNPVLILTTLRHGTIQK